MARRSARQAPTPDVCPMGQGDELGQFRNRKVPIAGSDPKDSGPPAPTHVHQPRRGPDLQGLRARHSELDLGGAPHPAEPPRTLEVLPAGPGRLPPDEP